MTTSVPRRTLTGLEPFADVLVAPREFFEKLRAREDRGAAVGFAGLMGFLPAVALFLTFPVLFLFAGRGYAHPAILGLGFLGTVLLKSIVGPIVAIVVGAFGGGLLVHGIGKVSGGAGSYDRSVIIAAYALAPLALERVLVRLLFLVPLVGPIFRYTPFIACAYWAFLVSVGIGVLRGGRQPVALTVAVIASPILLFVSRILGA